MTATKRSRPRHEQLLPTENDRQTAAANARQRRIRQKAMAASNTERLRGIIEQSLAGATSPDLRRRLEEALARLKGEAA
jgi:uncharacterized Zn finger protein